MMRLTIVKPDNLVILDKRSHRLSLTDVPGNLHALQWQGSQGHIEYSNQPNEAIRQLPGWTEPLIQEHQRLSDIEDTEREQAGRQAVHQLNGDARQRREEQSRNARLLKEQQTINHFVREQMP